MTTVTDFGAMCPMTKLLTDALTKKEAHSVSFLVVVLPGLTL